MNDTSIFKENYEKLGKWTPAEIIVGIAFILLAVLWLFRGDLAFGSFKIKGWTNILLNDGSNYIQDGTVAMLIALLLFMIHVPEPSVAEERQAEANEVDLELRKKGKPLTTYKAPLEDLSSDSIEEDSFTEDILISEAQQINEKKWIPIVEWEYVQGKMPWTIVFLFAGGFALNKGFNSSGLATYIGDTLSNITNLPLFLLLLLIVIVGSGLSNIASNTACANLLIPIIASISKNAQKYHPWLLMIPCAFATSVCFIMPIASPPNLIAMGSGMLETKDFLTTGLVINIVSILLVVLLSMALVPPIFNARGFPDWGKATE